MFCQILHKNGIQNNPRSALLSHRMSSKGFYRSCMILSRSDRETSTGYKHCQPRQRILATLQGYVHHFLSFICSECIPCWSSCRGLVVRRGQKGEYLTHIGHPFSSILNQKKEMPVKPHSLSVLRVHFILNRTGFLDPPPVIRPLKFFLNNSYLEPLLHYAAGIFATWQRWWAAHSVNNMASFQGRGGVFH